MAALALAAIPVTTTGTVRGGSDWIGAATTPPPGPVCTITGTEGRDVLRGTGGPDTICGLGGNDSLDGGAERDACVADRGDLVNNC